jgi:hypothetical protein
LSASTLLEKTSGFIRTLFLCGVHVVERVEHQLVMLGGVHKPMHDRPLRHQLDDNIGMTSESPLRKDCS